MGKWFHTWSLWTDDIDYVWICEESHLWRILSYPRWCIKAPFKQQDETICKKWREQWKGTEQKSRADLIRTERVTWYDARVSCAWDAIFN